MTELKTKPTNASVTTFINAVPDKARREDAKVVLALFKSITKEKPRMWGASIVGFGMFHYKSERSSQEGDWPLTGFSPRKQNVSLYVLTGLTDADLKGLGKYKRSVGCLYVNRLDDVDLKVLEKVIKKSYAIAKKRYRVT